MNQKTKERLIKLASNDLGAAADNLYRAKASFKNLSNDELNEKYGQSDSTCKEILDGYQSWYDEAKAVVDELTKD